MADELAALRAVSQHLSKRGESIKDFLARVSAKKSGHVLDFEAFYGVLASDGFRAPSASVTILEHTLTGTITEKKLSSMLAMADAIDDSAASGSTNSTWVRVSLALSGSEKGPDSWRQPLALAKASADKGDEMNFWSFSKDVLRPLLASHSLALSTQEIEQLMKTIATKPGVVSIRKFEQTIAERLATSRNKSNQATLAASESGYSLDPKASPRKPNASLADPRPKLAPPASKPVTPMGFRPAAAAKDDGDRGDGDDDDEEEEAFFARLAAKAKGDEGGPRATVAAPKPRSSPAELYGSLKSTPPNEHKRAPPPPASLPPSGSSAYGVPKPPPPAARPQLKEDDDDDDDDDEDDDDADDDGSEEEGESDDDAEPAQAKHGVAPPKQAELKRGPPQPPTVPAAAAVEETSLSTLLTGFFYTGQAPAASASLPASGPPPPGSSALVPTSPSPSFLDLFGAYDRAPAAEASTPAAAFSFDPFAAVLSTLSVFDATPGMFGGLPGPAGGGRAGGSGGGSGEARQVARERTAKELAAEKAAVDAKELARAAIAAKVEGESRERLAAAEKARRQEELDQKLAAAAAEAEREAKAAEAKAAAKARMADRAAARSGRRPSGVEERDAGGGFGAADGAEGPLPPGGLLLSDALLKRISMGKGNVAQGPPPQLSAGTGAPSGGGGGLEGSAGRSKERRGGMDQGSSLRSGGRSDRTGRSTASLATAVSFSTAGGDGVSGRGLDGGPGGGSSVGWSRAETRVLMGLVADECRSAATSLGGFMWDAVASKLRQHLKQDPALAARGNPQRRKGIDCRRRWDHSMKKAHATPPERLTREQKEWLAQFHAHKALMGGASGLSKLSARVAVQSIPEDRPVGGSARRGRGGEVV